MTLKDASLLPKSGTVGSKKLRIKLFISDGDNSTIVLVVYNRYTLFFIANCQTKVFTITGSLILYIREGS